MRSDARLARPALARSLALLAITAVLASCGGSDGGAPIETEMIAGRVLDGTIEGATVCIDLDANGRCDPAESQVRTNAAGWSRRWPSAPAVEAMEGKRPQLTAPGS